MEQEKSNYKFFPYQYLPDKIKNLLILIRFEKPIGVFLLVWPCWFALAILSIKEIKLYILFFIGSFCMRGVGCIINDYFDRNIDKSINRTSNRPLAKGSVNFLEVILLTIFLLLISLLILINFNNTAIIVSLCCVPLIIIYPLMKRFTYWPQLILGLTFSWGIFIVSAEINEIFTLKIILLYIACIFWTLGYDTIYAYQDREDDIKINLKSTAVLFGNKGKSYVMFFYFIFILFIWFAENFNDFKVFSSIILIIFLIGLLIFINKWSINSKSSSHAYFKSNNIIGLICFIFLFLSNNSITHV